MKLKVLIPLAILILAVVFAVSLVRNRRTPERLKPTPPPPLVRVEEAQARTVRLDVSSNGEVRPRTETVLVAQVGGRIDEVSDALAAGAFFSKGDVLARIDPRDYRVGVSLAEASVAQAEVTLAREEGEGRVARADWKALGSEGEPDALVLRKPQLAGARATLAAARASLEKARLDLSRTEIRAPYDGRVRTRSVDVGQFVAPGTPLARIYATDAAEIRLGLPVSRVGDVELARAGRTDEAPRVTLWADFGGRATRWEGTIVRVEGEIDPVTRLLHVVARVEDPFGRDDRDRMPMPAGLFVEARIDGRALERAFVVPRESLRGDGTLLVVEDGRLRERDVEVARVLGDEAIITGGLADGDLVCISDLAIFAEGMMVRVEQAETTR